MSDLIAELTGLGISLRSYAHGQHTNAALCPRCSHTRKKKNVKSLSVKIDDDGAIYNCHHCTWSGRAGKFTRAGDQAMTARPKTYTKPEQVKADPRSFPEHVMKFLTETRGITPAVIERNKLYWDESRKAIAFPYFVGTEIVNVKYRTMDKQFSQVAGARQTLYGINDLGADVTECIIVEGEFDKLALEVCGIMNVVSVPGGAPNQKPSDDGAPVESTGRFAFMAHAENVLRRMKKVTLATDTDEPGEALRYELSRRIGLVKCFNARFPVKDANECLTRLGVDVTLDCINDAAPIPIAGLYEIGDFEDALAEFFENKMVRGVPTGWENVDSLYSCMPGELTIITGIPNVGKSEWVDALMMNIAKHEDWRFAIFSPENGKEQHVAKLVEKLTQLPTDPKANNRISKEAFLAAARELARSFYFVVADDGEHLPTIDWILDKASAAVLRYGIRGILIDPWNEIEHQCPDSMNEGKYISQVLSKLKRWGRSHDVKVFLVAHPTKLKADSEGKYPIPTLYDIAGSAHFFNKTDNGITIHRSNDAAQLTEVYVKKARQKHIGRKGKAELRYDVDTGIYSVPQELPNHAFDAKDAPDEMVFDVNGGDSGA